MPWILWKHQPCRSSMDRGLRPGLGLALAQKMPLRSYSAPGQDWVKVPGAPPAQQGRNSPQRHFASGHRTWTRAPGIGKPRLLLSLTWPEGVLWAPGVPRTRHSGAGNLRLRRNSVLALGRRKVCVVARGGAIAMERRTSRREQCWNLHYRVSILVVHPHRNKQLKAQVKFPLAPVFIFWGLCTFHIIPKCVAKRFSPSGLIS